MSLYVEVTELTGQDMSFINGEIKLNIVLKKMSKEEFSIYFEAKVERYSGVLSENVHEVSSEEPLSKARVQLNNLLPKGG